MCHCQSICWVSIAQGLEHWHSKAAIYDITSPFDIVSPTNPSIAQAHIKLKIHTETNILNCYIPDQLQYTAPETEYTRLHSKSNILSSGPLSCFDVKRLIEYRSE